MRYVLWIRVRYSDEAGVAHLCRRAISVAVLQTARDPWGLLGYEVQWMTNIMERTITGLNRRWLEWRIYVGEL